MSYYVSYIKNDKPNDIITLLKKLALSENLDIDVGQDDETEPTVFYCVEGSKNNIIKFRSKLNSILAEYKKKK